jgi:hypothetical protein
LKGAVQGREIGWFASFYLLADVILVIAEIWLPGIIPDWPAATDKSYLKDIGGFFIAAQIGILGVVSIAIGLVTLIAQRGEGTSTYGDIRLYYYEALTYEIVWSSVALSVVLCVQQFWPFQFVAHLLGYGSSALGLKLALTGVHALWLCTNLVLFSRFLTISLAFVEPTARARMRERYLANVVVPNNLRFVFPRVLYASSAPHLITDAKDDQRLSLFAGPSFPFDGASEAKIFFRKPMQLIDVRIRPLAVALTRWWARSVRAHPELNGPRRGPFDQRPALRLNAMFQTDYSDHFALCTRQGGVPLDALEQWLVRRSFVFRRAGPPLPDPYDIIEVLVDNVMAQIDKMANTGFRDTFQELIQFHRFALEIYDSETEEGIPINLAEIGGVWFAPIDSWLRGYRRLFERAISKISSETYFAASVTRAPLALLPSDALRRSPAVVRSILGLGPVAAVILEAWFTRSVATDTGTKPLAGTDKRAYEEVLRELVGGWEDALRRAEAMFQWNTLANKSSPDQWNGFRISWAFLENHLRNSAFFVAAAVWNEDEIGLIRYSDSFLRWLDSLRAELKYSYVIQHHLLLTPLALDVQWDVVRGLLLEIALPNSEDFLRPREIFGVVVAKAFDDVVVVTSVITLAWHMTNQFSSDIGAEAARRLIFRQLDETEGTPRITGDIPPSPFERVLSTIIRSELWALDSQSGYSSRLNGLVEFLNGMSVRRRIPGRIYSSWGVSGWNGTQLQQLALLIATMQPEDQKLLAKIEVLAGNEKFYADGDTTLRRLVGSFETLQKILTDQANFQMLERGAKAIAPPVNTAAAIAQVDDFLKAAVAAIEAKRLDRLMQRPISPAKLNEITAKLTEAMHAIEGKLMLFRGFRYGGGFIPSGLIRPYEIGVGDKGQFADPPMDWIQTDLGDSIVNWFADDVAGMVWANFGSIPRTEVPITAAVFSPDWWAEVLTYRSRTGQNPILMIPDGRAMNILQTARAGQVALAGIRGIFKQGKPSGGGLLYACSIDDLDIYGLGHDDICIMFSSEMLEAINYITVPPYRGVVDLKFYDNGDPHQTYARIHYRCEPAWKDLPVYQFIEAPAPSASNTSSELT